jgi:hypothetical protein
VTKVVETQTTPASTPDTDAAVTPPASTPPVGSESGTQAPAGFVSQSELDKAQATARNLQSERDQLRSKLAAATPETPATPDAVADTATQIAAMERRMELREAKLTFKSDDAFKDADPSIFARAVEFDSVEAFQAALEDSVASRKTARDAMRAEVDAEVRAAYVAQYGELAATPPTTDGVVPAEGAMTLARLSALPQSEFEAYVTKNPDEYARLMSATS